MNIQQQVNYQHSLLDAWIELKRKYDDEKTQIYLRHTLSLYPTQLGFFKAYHSNEYATDRVGRKIMIAMSRYNALLLKAGKEAIDREEAIRLINRSELHGTKP